MRVRVSIGRVIAMLVVALAAMARSPYENLTREQIMTRSTEQIAPGLYTVGRFGERSS